LFKHFADGGRILRSGRAFLKKISGSHNLSHVVFAFSDIFIVQNTNGRCHFHQAYPNIPVTYCSFRPVEDCHCFLDFLGRRARSP